MILWRHHTRVWLEPSREAVVLSKCKHALSLNAKFVALFARVTTFLSDTDTFHKCATIAGYFIELEVSLPHTPRLKAIQEALDAEVDLVMINELIFYTWQAPSLPEFSVGIPQVLFGA